MRCSAPGTAARVAGGGAAPWQKSWGQAVERALGGVRLRDMLEAAGTSEAGAAHVAFAGLDSVEQHGMAA